MEHHKKPVGGSSSSSTNFDHLFGPKGSSTSSSSTSSSSIFGSIFSHPSTVVGRDCKKHDMGHRVGSVNNVGPPSGLSSGRQSNKGENITNREGSSMYQNETVEPCYFSSSIYYGGQENYSPRANTTDGSQHILKKDTDEDDPNGNASNSASRGNWWQGSLYY